MEKVTLYTKLSCHLCQSAYMMLLELTGDIPLEIDLVDITHIHNSHIESNYNQRIPVLARPHSSVELEWPFTPADIKAFLATPTQPPNPVV